MKKTIFALGMILTTALASSQIVINEFLADPADGLAGDANGDGVRDASDDEFVELVNVSGSTVDLEGWKISDNTRIRHEFVAGTLVAPGQAVVVFGGGTPTGDFGGAIVVTASDGSLSLNNSAPFDTITLRDAADSLIDQVSYGSEGVQDQSLTRNPDLTGSFVQHTTLGDGSLRFSPGVGNDGIPFAGERLTLTIDPASFSEAAGSSAAAGTVTRTGDTSEELLVSLASNDETEVVVPSVVAILVGQSSAVFAVGAVNDSEPDGDQVVRVTASAEGYFSGSFEVTVLDDEAPLPVMTLTANPTAISENGGTSTITVQMNVASPTGYTFNLSGNDPTELTVPASVTIAPDATSATFVVTAVDDADLDGAQNVIVTATDPMGVVPTATVTIRVDDDEVAVGEPSVIAYWDQNSNDLEGGGFGFTTSSFPQPADLGSGTITLADFDETAPGDVYTSIQSFAGSTVNAQPEVVAGGSLSPTGGTNLANNGMSIIFEISTLGRQGIVASWAQRGTNTGFSSRKFEWSLNKTDWTLIGEDTGALSSTFSSKTYDLTGNTAVEGHETIYFRIVLNGATNASGNNRFDNITFTSNQGGEGPGTAGVTTVDFDVNPSNGDVQWRVKGLGAKVWVLQASNDLGQGQVWTNLAGGYNEVDQPDGSVILSFFEPAILTGTTKRFYRLIEAP